MGKKIKYETKQLGYLIVVNSIFWINFFLYSLVQTKRIDDAVKLGLITYILGLLLLLGRKIIADLVTKYIETKKK